MNSYLKLLVKIRIHPLLWVVIAIAVVTANFHQLLILFLIIFVHEMGHVFSAHFFSWRINKITLLPFGGVVEMDEHGNRPFKEELIVILAGPFQHVWLVAAAYLLSVFSVISADAFTLFLHHNLILLIFNLLPIWPLDGGKVIFLLLSLNKSFFKAHQLVLLISAVSTILLSCSLLIYDADHLHLWIIIAFLIFSIVVEWRQRHFVFIRFLLERYYGKKRVFTKLKPITVNEDDRIFQVLGMFHRGYKHPIIINKNGKHKAQMDENELLHAYFSEKKTTATLAEILYLY